MSQKSARGGFAGTSFAAEDGKKQKEIPIRVDGFKLERPKTREKE
jgi:hypothetical protein